MEHILTGPYNKPTNNSRRPPRGAYAMMSRPICRKRCSVGRCGRFRCITGPATTAACRMLRRWRYCKRYWK
ncbi:MAG: hypothetical protein ACMX3H_14590 [Sodalis sp. (in: enterobacteria)]|uniref:hypothetical protein n=1 Tax=Sodalis sp. (in: enterobacteria) TaxID=1898979 RepID=UPI0039E6058E